MNERDLLRAYPAYAPYRELLREIFEEPPEVFGMRFPQLAVSWEPFLRHLLDRDFDIDHLRKAASDNRDFQQWLLGKNTVRCANAPGQLNLASSMGMPLHPTPLQRWRPPEPQWRKGVEAPSLVDEFIRDLRVRFRKRHGHPIDPGAVLDIRCAIECFLTFADCQQSHLSRKPPVPGAGS
jgi:hypothetical protein